MPILFFRLARQLNNLCDFYESIVFDSKKFYQISVYYLKTIMMTKKKIKNYIISIRVVMS